MRGIDDLGNLETHSVALGRLPQVVFWVLVAVFLVGCGSTNKSKGTSSNHPKETAKPHAAIQLPAMGPPVAAGESVVIIIRRAESGKVTVHRGDGRPFSKEDNQKQEKEVIDHIKAGLSGVGPFKKKMSHVLVKAEKGIKFREITRIHEAIGRAELSTKVLVETVFVKPSSTGPPQESQKQE